MMRHCGALDDVYSYEKMKHESPRKRTNEDDLFRQISAPLSDPKASAKLGSKKSSSFRWLSRQSPTADDVPGSSNRVGQPTDVIIQESSMYYSPSSPPKSKTRKPSARRIGWVDVLLGYHSLLQASPGYPMARQRKELYPTIGFIQNPHHGSDHDNQQHRVIKL